jgi:hypothetical protein
MKPVWHRCYLLEVSQSRTVVPLGQTLIFFYYYYQETEPQLVEDAVKYIIFLVDADRLFDTALGMYDFSLVLMIAQHAQKVAPLGAMLLRF